MKKTVRVIGTLLVFLSFGFTATAEELKLPTYPPTYRLSVGTSLKHLAGNPRVSEYEDTTDNIYLFTDIRSYPLPHRFHLFGYFSGEHDYFVDTGYAYRDILLYRLVSVGFVHHTDHYPYDLKAPSPVQQYEDRDPDDDYMQDIRKTKLKLRLKWPNYPLHLFFRYSDYHHKGNLQQRFLIGYFGNMNKVSQSRSLTKDTSEFKIGTNGHLGPVELEYFHIERHFDSSRDTILQDDYPEINSPPIIYRPADIYPHNIYPDIKGHGDSLKIHTSYTGQIVASYSVMGDVLRNLYSGVKRKTLRSSATLQYMPSHIIAMFLRMNYLNIEESNTSYTVLRGLQNQLTYDVRKSIDIEKKTVHLISRIRPIKDLTLIPSYSIEIKKRTDTEGWTLSEGDTTTQSYKLKVLSKPVRNLSIRAAYSHSHTKNPLYNFIPEDRDRIKLYFSYLPLPPVQLIASYTFSHSRRGNVSYYDDLTGSFYEGKDKKGTHHFLVITASTTPVYNLSITASVGYYRVKETSCLAFKQLKGDGTFTFVQPFMEHSVPYKDRAITYMLNITRRFSNRWNVSVDISATYSKGSFHTSTDTLSGIDGFSKINNRDSTIKLSSSYKLLKDTSIGLELLYESYSDRVNPDLNGRLYRGLIRLTKNL